MNKFTVDAVIREAGGYRYVPLREYESYEDAEIARKAYHRRNPGTNFLIEHQLGEEETEWDTEGKSIATDTLFVVR